MILCDTNILIEIYRDNTKIIEIIKQIGQKNSAVYSKIGEGEKECGIDVIDKLTKFFGLSTDELVHSNGKIPKAVKVEDKTVKKYS